MNYRPPRTSTDCPYCGASQDTVCSHVMNGRAALESIVATARINPVASPAVQEYLQRRLDKVNDLIRAQSA
ncbi:hypothetical protein LCGC14_2244620 [marine sediment metagenome]|uniref:Uncharacterized protein n=1 Tax=marine sediment metagenome TaxID=412755 RepID=A0A0F9DS06_9ZZZZ